MQLHGLHSGSGVRLKPGAGSGADVDCGLMPLASCNLNYFSVLQTQS